MNYALNFTGAGHVTVPTLTGANAVGRICRADIELTNYTSAFIMGNNTAGNNSSVRIVSATSVAVRIGDGGTRTVTLAANSIPLNTRLVFEVFKTSAPTLEVRVNGSAVGSTAISAGEVTTAFSVSLIGLAASPTGRFVGKMYELDLFGNTFLNTDEPTATTWGAGALVDFPTDGTQWTAYGGATTPIAFTGTIPAQTFTNGQAVSVDLSGYFSGTQTPFTFANTGAALTGTGLSISSAGLLTGTATTGGVTGVIVTGTDADLDTASSNAFNVTVSAASTPVSFSGTIPAITGTQNAAITPVNTSTYFSGSLTPFTYSLFSGTLPSGVTLNSSTGVISGTPTVSFSGNIVVRATDSGSNTADSNSIAVTIAAAAGTITITDVVNNTNTPWASAAVDAATVMPVGLGSVVVNKTGLSVTAGAELVISDASIVTGTEYIIILKIGTAYGWYRAVAT